MKRLAIWALLALCMLLVFVPLAIAAEGAPVTIDAKTMVWFGATSVGSFLVGIVIKKWPKLEWLSNRLIPYTIVAIGTVGYMVVLHLGFVEAMLMAGASSMGAVLLAEGPAKKLTAKPTAPAGGAS